MKKFLVVLFTLASVICFGQPFIILDSTKLQSLKPGEFKYLNISVDNELKIEGKENVLIDISSIDAPKTGVDSVLVTLNKSTYSLTDFKPLYFKDVDSSIHLSLQYFSKGKPLIFKSKGSESLYLDVIKMDKPTFAKDTIVFGVLAIILALIFYTAGLDSKKWRRFYTIVPALLLCYLLPAILDSFGLISQKYSGLYPMARDYLLPAALILMTIGIDFKGLFNLGPKALIMFLTATVGIIIGGPLAIMVYSMIDPEVVGGIGSEAAWRGMSTIAGSWIGGGANQNAMYETYKYAPDLYGKMIVVDIVVANLWMAFLLWGAARAEKFDKWLKADSSSIEELKNRVSAYQDSIAKVPTVRDLMVILGVAFGVVAFSHFCSGYIADFFGEKFGENNPFASGFLWIVVIATTGGLLLSLTKARVYEGAGASKIGGVFIYILVTTIGMKMELGKALEEPQLILVGIIWMLFHAGLLFLVGKLIKAPFFFIAVGSKANVGGAASAPIVAAAFHPSLASVGAILAVFGYALGTYGAILCAEIMASVAP